MNEVRDLILGIDFGKEYSQISYFDRKADEPCTVSVKAGTSRYEAPTLMCCRKEQKDFVIGLEADYFAREKGGTLIDHLYEICDSDTCVELNDIKYTPARLLADYLKGMLRFLGVLEVVNNIKMLVITVEDLTPRLVANLQEACDIINIPRHKCMLLDYEESFYYYVLTQKKETWNRSVAWYDFKGSRVAFRKLVMNIQRRPIEVRIEKPVTLELPQDPFDRDREFTEFVRGNLGNDLYSSVQITGEGFSQDWAKDSVNLLCERKRKVYFGNNLFSRGACACGVERLEKKNLKSYTYLSHSVVSVNVGMDLRVMGAPAYYPMISAGTNWYECRSYCEIILDNADSLVFIIDRPGTEERKRMGMKLPGLPPRPNKTTRLGISLKYISADECLVEVEDVGFGELFPSSRKKWKERVKW